MNETAVPTTRFRFVVAVMFMVVIGLTMVALLVPIHSGGRVVPAIGDMVHAPLFACLTLFAFTCIQRTHPAHGFGHWIKRGVLIGVMFALIGVGSEFAQGLSGRSKSLHDAIANVMGITTAVGMLTIWGLRKWKAIPRSMAVALALVAISPISVAWLAPIATLLDVRAMHAEFPLLGSFEREAELKRWHFAKSTGKRVTNDATDGRYSLEVTYQVHQHPTATMYEMKSDWSAMEYLMLDATLVDDAVGQSSGKSTTLAIQVIDHDHDKDFQQIHRETFELLPGQTTPIRIACDAMRVPPARDNGGRKIDLKRILYLDLQLVRPDAPTIVRFDSIRLIPKATR